MGRFKKKKCKHCRRMFRPDCRNYKRQRYCHRPECRKASKAESQRKWLAKPENEDYFKGTEHVEKVRQWRKNNPGYRKPKASVRSKPDGVLQDFLSLQALELMNKNGEFCAGVLQDLLKRQHLVIIGIISQISGFSLQDDIAGILRRMQQSGQEIYTSTNTYGGIHDGKSPDFKPQSTPDPQKLQLDRSPAGP